MVIKDMHTVGRKDIHMEGMATRKICTRDIKVIPMKFMLTQKMLTADTKGIPMIIANSYVTLHGHLHQPTPFRII
jgi:hypothetical protein